MLRRQILLILAVIFLLASLLPAAMAQEELTYGDSVDGEITNQSFEVEYSFTGAEGDVIAITLTPEDIFEGLSRPVVLLLDEDFEVIETVDAAISEAVLVNRLAADGTYHIIATREDGRSGETAGTYTLSLNLVPVLEAGESLEVEISSEGGTTLYAIVESSDFVVDYHLESGDFRPELIINRVISTMFGDSNLEAIANLSGSELTRGSVGINAAEDEYYIVTLGESVFDFNFDEVTANVIIEYHISE